MIGFLKHFLSQLYQEYLFFKKVKKKFPTIQLENNVSIKGNLEHLHLGENVMIQSNVVIHLGGFEWSNYQGFLRIGDNSCLSPNVVIYAAGSGGVTIGKNFDCGPSVGIFASRTDYMDSTKHHFAPVEIGDNVVIYANAVICPGMKIGDHAVVAAGAVVREDVLPYTLVGGCPARLIKNLKVVDKKLGEK